MVAQPQEANELMVEMLGEFRVRCGETEIVTEKTRNNKPVQLLKYFICNKNRMLPQEVLIRELMMGEEGDDRINILKNVVYRLRKMLVEAGLPKSTIRNGQSTYGFYCPVPCRTDTEAFEQAAKQAAREETLEACLQALGLYRGEFLQSMSAEPWVAERALHYQTLYLRCLGQAYELAEQQQQFAEVLEYMKTAAAIYPYEEAVFLKYISVLHALKKQKEALREYDRFVTRLYNDLGVNPTPAMEQAYRTLTAYVQQPVSSITDVRNTIAEEDYGKGAFYCNLGVFENLYQVTVRHMERSGKSTSLLLCSLREADGTLPAAGQRLDFVSQYFMDTVSAVCRRADVYTRYSPTQFLIMLLGTDYEGAQVTGRRISAAFYKSAKVHNIVLESKSISAVDLQHIMEHAEEETHPAPCW